MGQIDTKIPFGHIDPQDLAGDKYKFVSRFGTLYLKPMINTDDCWSCYEEFRKEDGAFEWPVWATEMHYIVRGRAHIQYSLPPLHTEVHSVDAGPGDVYLMPKGSYFRWTVISDEPFGHICTAGPSPFTEEYRKIIAAIA